MILLEYLIAQHQDDNVSVAINSRKVKQQNPALLISRNLENIIFNFRGLHYGEIENINGEPRATRIDFYIGMEDLIEQRTEFPATTGTSLGNIQGLRIPVGTERKGGKKIRWNGPLARIVISDINATIPPFRISRNENSELILNIDRESSPYPITSEGGNHTMKELHFGLEHDFTINQDGRVNTCRISFTMTENEYATFLNYIGNAIDFYSML